MAKGGADVSITIDYKELKEQASKYVSKFHALSDNPHLKKEVMIEWAHQVKPFVPYRTGRLMNTFSVYNNGAVKYHPVDPRNHYHYADVVYEGKYVSVDDGNIHNMHYYKGSDFGSGHEFAGPRWNVRFERSPLWEDFVQSAALIIGKEFNDDTSNWTV